MRFVALPLKNGDGKPHSLAIYAWSRRIYESNQREDSAY